VTGKRSLPFVETVCPSLAVQNNLYDLQSVSENTYGGSSQVISNSILILIIGLVVLSILGLILHSWFYEKKARVAASVNPPPPPI